MKSTGIGILSAITASICCIGPLILIALGLGSLGLGAVLGKYHWVFLTVGVFLILFSWKRYFREKERCNIKKCRMENKKLTLTTLIMATIVVLSFVGLNFYTYTGASVNVNQIAHIAGSGTIIIPVEGMTCFTCEVTISSALKKIDGVATVKASAKKGDVKVIYDPKKTNISKLIEIINKTGYKASLPGGK